MVSRETQHHTTLNFYKLDIKKPQLCGFCHIILFTSVKNPGSVEYILGDTVYRRDKIVTAGDLGAVDTEWCLMQILERFLL